MIEKKYVDSFDVIFEHIYKGNQQAKDISFKLLNIAHTWDDIVDKDKELSDTDINSAFVMSIFEIQNSPLWFSCGLNHHVLNVFLRWQDANAIEKDANSTDEDLAKAYMLRAGIYDIFVIIAYSLHGLDWAKDIGVMVRKSYGEKLGDFIKEVRLCQIQ